VISRLGVEHFFVLKETGLLPELRFNRPVFQLRIAHAVHFFIEFICVSTVPKELAKKSDFVVAEHDSRSSYNCLDLPKASVACFACTIVIIEWVKGHFQLPLATVAEPARSDVHPPSSFFLTKNGHVRSIGP